MKLEISSNWKWAAMDEDEEWMFYDGKPLVVGRREWFANSAHVRVGLLVSGLPSYDSTNWKDSLHQIIDGELVKYHDLKVDDRVMVRRSGSPYWNRRHFSHFGSTGRPVCFNDGATAWASQQGEVTTWDEWRLPTEEELR